MAASDFHLFEVIPVESERVRGITTKAILTEDENNALRWKSSTGNVSNPLSFDRPVQEVISTRTDDSVFVFTDKQGFVFPAGHKHPINEFEIQKNDLDMAIRIKTFSHNVSSFIVAILWTDKLIIYAEESRFELKLPHGLKDLTFVDCEYIYAWGNSDIYRIRIFEDGPVVFRHLKVNLPTVQDKFQSLLNSDQKRKSEEIKTLQAGRRFILVQTAEAVYSISNSTGDILAVRKTPGILEMKLSCMKRQFFSESVQMLVLIFEDKLEFVELDSLGKAIKVEWSMSCSEVRSHSSGSVSVVYENDGKTLWLTPLGPEEKIQKLVSRNELQKALAFARHYELDEEIIFKAELKNRIQEKAKAADPGHFQAVRFLSKKITDIEFFRDLLKIVEDKELKNALIEYIAILVEKEGVDEFVAVPLMGLDQMRKELMNIIQTKNFPRLSTLLFPYQNHISAEYQTELLKIIPSKIPTDDLIAIIGMFQKIFEISDSGFCQNQLPKWSSERALNLEKEEPADWPENALRVLCALRKPELAKIDFKFTGKEYSYEESIELLMGNLDALNELKVQYRLKIPLSEYMDPNQRSQWLLNWINNEIQNRHDETVIKRTFNDVVKPLTYRWALEIENFLLPFLAVEKNIPLSAKVHIMKLIPSEQVRRQQLLELLEPLSHPFPDFLVEFMKTMLPA